MPAVTPLRPLRKKRRRPIRATIGFLARGIALVISLVLVVCLWVIVFGFPDRACDELTRLASSSGPFALEADTVHLSGWDELVFTRASAYRRRVVGPAAAEAAEVRVKVDWNALYKREFFLRSIEVRDGVVRPFSLFAQARPGGDEGVPDLNFRLPLSVRNCTVQGVTAQAVDLTIAGKGSVLSFENISGTVSNAGMSGAAEGIVRYDMGSGIVTGRIHTVFSPMLLEPVFAEWHLDYLVYVLRRFELSDPPRVDTAFTIVTGTNYHLALDSQVRMQDATYRGVPFMRTDGVVHVRHGPGLLTVGVDPLVVVRRDGVIEGRFLVDTSAELVSYDGSSSIHPRALARLIGIFTNDELKPFAFEGAVRVTSSGMVDYRDDLARTGLEVRGAAATLGYGDFIARDVTGVVRMTGRTNSIESFSGQFLDGALTGRGEVLLPVTPDGKPTYVLDLRLEKADFARLAALRKAAPGQQYRGRLDGNLELEGVIGEGQAKTIKGSGSVHIRDGQVFSLPIFGGLSKTMAKIIPGLDFVMRQSDAKAEFTIRDGKISSDRIEITGDVLSLTGRGEYTIGGELDFTVRVTLMRENSFIASLLRKITNPISWLFEFRLKGTPDDPQWYPHNLSKDLLEKIGLRDKPAEPKAEP